ncbi:MAG: hypothetical protein KDA92_25780, partial [Planctomycetales bacterium]|nr:hypothetical protein [Planctomycetales bacterium]
MERSFQLDQNTSTACVTTWLIAMPVVAAAILCGPTPKLAHADLQLDIRDQDVAAGEENSFEVLVRTQQAKQTLTAWDAE